MNVTTRIAPVGMDEAEWKYAATSPRYTGWWRITA